MNPALQALALEFARQFLRWIGVLLMNLPWVPSSIVSLTTNEEIVLWFAGLIGYALSDTAWLVSFVRRVRAWWAR